MAEVIQGHNGRVPSPLCPKLGLVVGAPQLSLSAADPVTAGSLSSTVPAN
jgi:hypothetical protein